MVDVLDKKEEDTPCYESIERRWDWVITFMITEDPFVHEILMMMEKKSTKGIPTMGVYVEGSSVTLLYNPDFVTKLSNPELMFLITHEVYHVVLHHCTKRQPEDPQSRGLFNKAADLAINSLIPDTPDRRMPQGKLKGLRPKDFDFDEKLSMEQYLQLLRDQEDENKSKSGSGGGGGEGGEGEGEGEDGDFDDHGGWSDSELLKEMVREKVQQISKNERIWGTMPGDTKETILAAQQSQISWSKYLRHYLGTLLSSNYESTMKRPNRRFGYPYCGKKRTCTDRKLVAIDTSGSVGDKELAQFLAELNKLAEAQPVDLVLFDTNIQGGIVPFEKKRVSYEFKGRGGTDFQEVMDIAQERRYHSLIVLTDGYAPAPTKPAFVKDVLWVITGDGQKPTEWGTEIKIK